jgi:hypothetical protein
MFRNKYTRLHREGCSYYVVLFLNLYCECSCFLCSTTGCNIIILRSVFCNPFSSPYRPVLNFRFLDCSTSACLLTDFYYFFFISFFCNTLTLSVIFQHILIIQNEYNCIYYLILCQDEQAISFLNNITGKFTTS